MLLVARGKRRGDSLLCGNAAELLRLRHDSLVRHLVQSAQEERMGLVKTRRLAAMQKQQRAKAAMKPPTVKNSGRAILLSWLQSRVKHSGVSAEDLPRYHGGDMMAR